MLYLDAELEDTGNYTCEIRGLRSTLLHHVTHTVLVQSNLFRFLLTGDIAVSHNRCRRTIVSCNDLLYFIIADRNRLR